MNITDSNDVRAEDAQTRCEDGGAKETDAEKDNNKFKNQLSDAIVVETPNVKWSDDNLAVVEDVARTLGGKVMVDRSPKGGAEQWRSRVQN